MADDIEEAVEEMDEFQDCGVSCFDGSNDDSEVVGDGQNYFDHVNEVQRVSPNSYVPEHAYAQTEDSHTSCDVQRNAPNTTHEQDQTATSTLLPAITAVGNLSSGFVRNTSPFNFATAAFPSQQSPNSRPRKGTSHQQDNNLLTMSRSNPKLPQDAQGLQFDDDEDYQFPPNRSVFLTTEEEEDFLEALEREVGPALTGGNEELQPLPREPYDQPVTARRRVVREPTAASVTGSVELTEQNETQAQPNPVQTTQHVQQRAESSTPNPLTAFQGPHDMQQTYRFTSQAQPIVQQNLPQSYQTTYQGTEPPKLNPSLTSSTRAELQKMAAQIDHSNDPLVQTLLANAPGVDLSEPRLTDRCRGMEYIPFRTAEETNRIHSDHVHLMQEVMSRLRAAISRRLGGTQAQLTAVDSRVGTIENFLYVKGTHILRSHFSTQDKLFANLVSLNRGTAQLTLLHRILQHVDLTIRPNGPVHLQNSLIAWYVAALKWQREIHEDWINELDTGKKRKVPDDDDDDVDDGGNDRPSKRARNDDSNKVDDKPVRRPGRPPGSLNKSTIAARQKQAARAKEEEQRKQGQKSSLPELTREDVRLAQESAARYARYQDGPGPAVLTNPRMTAPIAAPFPTSTQVHSQERGHGRGHNQYQFQPQNQPQPQPQQSQLRSGYFPQFRSQTVHNVPNPFVNPFNTASMHQLGQPTFPQHQIQPQPQPQSRSQSFHPYSNLAQAHLRPAIHPSLLTPHGSPPPPPPPPPPSQSTQRYTYPVPPQPPQPAGNNDNDDDDDDDDDGHGNGNSNDADEFTNSPWNEPDFH